MRALEYLHAKRKGGWLAALTKNESALLDAYAARADGETGVCWASDEELARELGHRGTNHVQAARKRLRDVHKLLTPVDQCDRMTETYRLTVDHDTAGRPLASAGAAAPARVEGHSRFGSDDDSSTPESGVIPPVHSQIGSKSLPNREHFTPDSGPTSKDEVSHEVSHEVFAHADALLPGLGTLVVDPSTDKPTVPAASRKSRSSTKRRKNGKPTNPNHAVLVAYWVQSWNRVYAGKYVFMTREAMHIKAILQGLDNNLGLAKAAIDRYLADSFYEGHSLATFCNHFSKFTVDAKGARGNQEPAYRTKRRNDEHQPDKPINYKHSIC